MGEVLEGDLHPQHRCGPMRVLPLPLLLKTTREPQNHTKQHTLSPYPFT